MEAEFGFLRKGCFLVAAFWLFSGFFLCFGLFVWGFFFGGVGEGALQAQNYTRKGKEAIKFNGYEKQ